MAKTDYKTIEDYHSAFSGETLERMETIRELVFNVAPNAEEVISYQIPAFKLGEKYHLIYYCAFPNHLTISSVWTEAMLKEFEDDLKGMKISKSAIQLPHGKPLPIDLIKRILEFRKREFEAKNGKMEKSKIQTVTAFLSTLEHPLKKEIEYLRKLILNANTDLTENIKWNAPNFCLNDEDRITMRIHPPKQIQLIFHRGAKVQELPKNNIITDDTNILIWKTTDRAVASFANLTDIKTSESDLNEIINQWLKVTTK